MTSFTAVKDPQSVVTWTMDWSDWLNSDTVSTSTWSVTANESPVTLTVDSNSIAADTSVSPNLASNWTLVTVSSGTAGVNYTLTNHIVTATGLEADRSITVRVWNR